MIQKIKSWIWKKVVLWIVNDAWYLNDEQMYKRWFVRDVHNNTNHITGDDWTIVVDDVMYRDVEPMKYFDREKYFKDNHMTNFTKKRI